MRQQQSFSLHERSVRRIAWWIIGMTGALAGFILVLAIAGAWR